MTGWQRRVFCAVGLLLGVMASGPALSECSHEQTANSGASRYLLKGGEVYDKKTDLTWQRCSVGQTWDGGVRCVGVPRKFTHAQANAGWAIGWRMPTVDELKTLVAKNCKNPAIDEDIFPDAPSEWYHID